MSEPVERARGLLARPGAWLEARDDGYALRLSPDRRSRVVLRLGEIDFRELARRPGLAVRAGGGWSARIGSDAAPTPAVGRPGIVEGQRTVCLPGGGVGVRRVNLGESPVAWLARRKDHAGRPWLTPAEIAAGERLRIDGELASAGTRLTMRWDALPRSGSGTGADFAAGDRAGVASRRVAAALTAVGPALAPMLSRVCIGGSALQAAEQELGLRRRQGKSVLKEGLARLAAHYGR